MTRHGLTTIAIDKETYRKLRELGKTGESFNTVLRRVLAIPPDIVAQEAAGLGTESELKADIAKAEKSLVQVQRRKDVLNQELTSVRRKRELTAAELQNATGARLTRLTRRQADFDAHEAAYRAELKKLDNAVRALKHNVKDYEGRLEKRGKLDKIRSYRDGEIIVNCVRCGRQTAFRSVDISGGNWDRADAIWKINFTCAPCMLMQSLHMEGSEPWTPQEDAKPKPPEPQTYTVPADVTRGYVPETLSSATTLPLPKKPGPSKPEKPASDSEAT